MKKDLTFVLTLLNLLVMQSMLFPQTMDIYLKDGRVEHIILAQIDSIKFSENETSVVTDYDGNVYKTIKIGEQVWMAENLRVTHYRNGDSIPIVTDNSQWTNLNSGAYCDYANDPNYSMTYGRLYNWFAVADARGLAPAGWHVPSDAEWQTLVNYLGGDAVAGGKMKTTGTIEAGTGLWYHPNTGATNEYGFSALPGGYRGCYGGTFGSVGYYGHWWSATEYNSSNAWYRLLYYYNSGVNRNYGYSEQSGFSVRCVRD